MISSLNKTLVFMLVFTVISSFFAYIIVVRAYDSFSSDEVYYTG